MTEHRIKRRRMELFIKRGGLCEYCDGETWMRGLETKAMAMSRLGIASGTAHSSKMIRYAEATFEHIRRRADGGTGVAHNGMLACMFCNVSRGEVDIRVNRMDMQALVAAGLHPVNRPAGRVDNYRDVRRFALRALRNIRSGKPIINWHQKGVSDDESRS
jgi:hypothetical protein